MSVSDARLRTVGAHGGGRVALEGGGVHVPLTAITGAVGSGVEASHGCLDAVEALGEEGEVVWSVGHGLRLAILGVARW